MEIGSVECVGEIFYSIKNLQTGMDHFSLMESLVEGKNEFLLKKLEFEPGTLSLFRVRTNTTCTLKGFSTTDITNPCFVLNFRVINVCTG